MPVHRAVRQRRIQPVELLFARAMNTFAIQWGLARPMLPIGMAVYYLSWQYLVGLLNQ